MQSCAVCQRLTVIGKRQRHQAPPGQPALDLAEDYRLLKLSAARRRVCDGAIAIGCLQYLEPRTRMKYRSVGVMRDQFVPAIVGQWIDLLHDRCGVSNARLILCLADIAQATINRFHGARCVCHTYPSFLIAGPCPHEWITIMVRIPQGALDYSRFIARRRQQMT